MTEHLFNISPFGETVSGCSHVNAPPLRCNTSSRVGSEPPFWVGNQPAPMVLIPGTQQRKML
jgi:hypothetical protein